MHKAALLVLATLAIVSCQDGPVSTPAEPSANAALAKAGSRVVPGQYIVVFRQEVADVPDLARQLVAQSGGTLRYIYTHAIKGFAAELPDAAAAALARHPSVAYVEPDQVGYAFAATQEKAPWGLDRIDQRSLPLSGTYTYTNTGYGIRAYIIDTGIRYSHVEFGGRAVFGYDGLGGDGSDCNGHGTHVAGIAGGATYGVAKELTLVSVRVFGCEFIFTTSMVIAGVDWVAAYHVKPAVANMSLGTPESPSLDQAVQNLINTGVSVTAAAGQALFGDRAKDACLVSPARVPDVMTISMTDDTDTKVASAYYGDCVDWFAPGSKIPSAWYTSDTDTKRSTGTSFATPHTTGVAALYLQSNPTATPVQVRDALYQLTTKNVVKKSLTANNHLLFTNF